MIAAMWFVDKIFVPVDIHPSGAIEVLLYRKPEVNRTESFNLIFG